MPTDKELDEKILPKCSLEWMKANQTTFITPKEYFSGQFVREGKVGKNRGQLSDEQLARLRAKCEQELPPDLVAFLYCETK
jgi:hypothetical protein